MSKVVPSLKDISVMVGVAQFQKPKVCLLGSPAGGVGVVQKPRSPMVPGQVPAGEGSGVSENNLITVIL